MHSEGTVFEALPNRLHDVLQYLHQNPSPFVPSPPETKKRASVALILRVRPAYANWPSSGDFLGNASLNGVTHLKEFFEQDWVQSGDPEALFIKRTSRKGDRWGGQVALPGGGRDPEDEDDRATAIRETAEEVGLDLTAHAIAVGSLPQRVVTASWGKIPFMVLCPYVFLLTHHDVPPLRLQPTEVASTHWVPLRALLSPNQRTIEFQDVSARLAVGRPSLVQHMLRTMLGHMKFCAIRLNPSESLHANSVPDIIPDQWVTLPTFLESLKKFFSISSISKNENAPLLLWGLTLGVLADLLYLLPPHDTFDLWTYPTFTSPDVRLTLWLLSYGFRKGKQEELRSSHGKAFLGTDQHTDGMAALNDWSLRSRPLESKSQNISADGQSPALRNTAGPLRASGVSVMLEGYYDIVRRAVRLAMIARCTSVIAAAWVLYIKRRRN